MKEKPLVWPVCSAQGLPTSLPLSLSIQFALVPLLPLPLPSRVSRSSLQDTLVLCHQPIPFPPAGGWVSTTLPSLLRPSAGQRGPLAHTRCLKMPPWYHPAQHHL